MPSFFAFQTGNEAQIQADNNDASPLLGRFRAVPAPQRRRRRSVGDLITGNWRRSFTGYGSIFGDDSSSIGEGVESSGCRGWIWRMRKKFRDVWIEPKQGAVRGVMERWWWRWLILFGLPAAVAVIWCAVPFPQYPLESDGEWDYDNDLEDLVMNMLPHRKLGAPGHGAPRVQVNFWFFLFVYYGFYNITALLWITKVFNIYSLNWWPQSLGFPLTISLIATTSLVVPIPLYYWEETRALVANNTAWILWTFCTMAMPLTVACAILMCHERHLSLRQSLSETQRIFTTSWFVAGGEYPTVHTRQARSRAHISVTDWDPDSSSEPQQLSGRALVQDRRRWLPASFVRFIWFCLALSVGMLAYVFGEVYSEIYLRTLPHSNVDTVFYVYSWVFTIHLLDMLTGFIVGGSEGERVGSYPLGWIFKLYFMLTYQTYVRALYARLRSPSQFIILQVISSSILIIFAPISMSSQYHSLMTLLHINNQSYSTYKKHCGRNIFIRGIAENVSMLAFLGEVLVLHFGGNSDVYPYFAFDDPDELYNFELTFYASMVTWACEILAGWIVRRVVALAFKFNVTAEGKMDFCSWPELLPTSAVVVVHVLQNMLFSMVRLKFF